MIGYCDSCRYDKAEVKKYEMHKFSGGLTYRNMCDLCASTDAGNALEYPEQYTNADVLKTICYVGNSILKAIKDK